MVAWNAEAPHEKVFSRSDDNSPIHAVDFSPSSTLLVTASENRTASIWNITSHERVSGPFYHEARVIAAKFSPQSDRTFATATEKSVCIYGVDDEGNYSFPVDIPMKVTSYQNTGLVWSNEQLVIISDGKIKTITTPYTSPSEWLAPSGISPLFCGIAVARDAGFIACSAPRTVWLWNMSKLPPTQIRFTRYEGPGTIRVIAPSPDDRFLAIGGEGGVIIESFVPRIIQVHVHDVR